MTLTVQQALHGYSDGHRLIASSLKLSNADARLLLVMSDLSGSGVKPERGSYLTGYPLETAGRYVLARTWAAPEMPRPGCVWTHSLIIDYADLAALTSAAGLLATFQRPTDPSSRSGYGVGLTVADLPTRRFNASVERLRGVVNAVYAAPDRPILMEAQESDDDEHLAIAIWMQQWPRLRRAFGFCTLAGMDRSNKGASLDLQMAPGAERQARSKFPGVTVASEVEPSVALEHLIDDLMGDDSTNIREFLRRTGGDVEGGRRAMVPLCRLHAALFAGETPNLAEAVSALASLDSLGSRSARSVRSLVVRQAIAEIDRVDDTVFDFLLDSLQNASAVDQPALGVSFSRELWFRAPDRFVAAIGENGPAGAVCEEALNSMELAEIIPGIEAHPDFASIIVPRRPDIAERSDFWRIPDISDDFAGLATEKNAARVAAALIAAERANPATSIVGKAEPGELVAALESQEASEVRSTWLRSLASQPGKLAGGLASGMVSRLETVVALSRTSAPDDVPNDYGEDPWVISFRTASGSLSDSDRDYLAAFAVSRALGRRSRSKAELFRFGYTRVYRALQNSRLPSDVERMVTWRLDWGSWFEWDNCSRLRETTVRNFVDGHLDPEIFGRLTDDGGLAVSLIDEAARSGRGRRYLAEVRQTIQNASDKGIKARADHIAKKIK